MSSGVAIANCAATSARRRRRTAGLPVDDRPSDRRDASTEPPVPCIAGTNPKINPLQAARPASSHNTGAPSSISCVLGKYVDPTPRSSWTPAHARPAPSPTAPAASTALSARRYLTTRPRDAPSAARTASSWRRLATRAISRFDAFAHAISHTRATEASARPAIVSTSPTTAVLRSSMLHVALSSWYEAFQIGKIRLLIAWSSLAATDRSVCARRRATTE